MGGTEKQPLPLDLMSAAAVLAENLSRSQPLVTFYQCQARLGADHEARALLERYTDAQTAWRRQQAQGGTQLAAEQMRTLQQAIRANTVIGEYGRAQQAAAAYLREINGEISQLLGVDFGGLTRRAGCC